MDLVGLVWDDKKGGVIGYGVVFFVVWVLFFKK